MEVHANLRTRALNQNIAARSRGTYLSDPTRRTKKMEGLPTPLVIINIVKWLVYQDSEIKPVDVR